MDIADQKSKVDGPDAYRMTALGRQPPVVKQLFSDRSAATVTGVPATPEILYGKWCRNGIPYANLNPLVFRTC